MRRRSEQALECSRRRSSELFRSSGEMRPNTDTERHDVQEPSLLICTPDLACQLPRYGCAPGLALDLTVRDENGEAWDFSLKRIRDKAERLIAEQQPTLLVGSPLCTKFSAWQYINRAKRPADNVERELVAGRVRLTWGCKLYRDRVKRGAFFLHEHPAGST